MARGKKIIEIWDKDGKKTIDDSYYFKHLKWVMKAKMIYNDLPGLNGLLFEEGGWVACDGHRLHFYMPDGYQHREGKYDVIAASRSKISLGWFSEIKDANWPDWQAICPNIYLALDQMPISYSSEYPTNTYAEIHRKLFKKNILNMKYVQDLDDFDGTAYYFGEKEGMVFMNYNQAAIIMPMSG